MNITVNRIRQSLYDGCLGGVINLYLMGKKKKIKNPEFIIDIDYCSSLRVSVVFCEVEWCEKENIWQDCHLGYTFFVPTFKL